ncbi:MAG: hypothetical protein AB7T49_10875 [Oligoflexales bacterium]
MKRSMALALASIVWSAVACKKSEEEATSSAKQANVESQPTSSQVQNQAPEEPQTTVQSQDQQKSGKESFKPGLCDAKIAQALYCRPTTSPEDAGLANEASACLTITKDGELTAVTPAGDVETCPPAISCDENNDEASPYLLNIGKGLSVPMASAVECGENERQLNNEFAKLQP